MARVIVLDSGPLGMVSHPRNNPEIKAWMQERLRLGTIVAIPEIADYEIRRELIQIGSMGGIRRLDVLSASLLYLPLTTATMRRAAEFWAQMRRLGTPTADPKALDGDVILAAQAAILSDHGDTVIVATGNVAHLGRLVTAVEWQNIV